MHEKTESMIAIYSRKSRFTGKGESIGNQVELCREYVRNFFGKEDADRCTIFEDEGFSGGDLKRPAFLDMMDQIRKHRFRAIVVYRLDRISRNISDFTGLIDELTKLGVSFVSIREQFDTSTPMGRAMMFIISVFSQLERETIAERIRDNMHELAKTGRWLGGNVPTGFKSESVSKVTVDGKLRRSYKLVPVPEEAEIPQMIFDLYTASDSLTFVETELLRRGIKTKQGKVFTRFAIKAILQNPVYMVADEHAYRYFSEREADVCFAEEAFDGSCGIMAYNRTHQEKGRTALHLPVSQWIIALGKHPGLVPSVQWIRVQESLERNKLKVYRKNRSNEALMTGLVYCTCGGRMYPKLSQSKTASGETRYAYVCKNKERSKGVCCSMRNVSGNLLDTEILGLIKSLPEHNKSFVAQLANSRGMFADRVEQHGHQLAAMRAEYTRQEKRINGLIESLAEAEDSVAKSPILKRMEELLEANRMLENRICELEGLANANRLSDGEFANLCQMLSVFRTSLEEITVSEKRAVLQTVIHKVIWDGTNAHVVLFGAALRGRGFMDREEGENSLTDKIAQASVVHWCEDSKCYMPPNEH